VLILKVSEATALLMSLADGAMRADGCRVDTAYKTSISETAWKYFIFLLLRLTSLTETYLTFFVLPCLVVFKVNIF